MGIKREALMKYGKEDVFRVSVIIADRIKANTELLSNLDGLSGDGDLGESMEKSSGSLVEAVSTLEFKDMGDLFLKCSLAMNKAAPSTLGTLLSGAVMAVAKEMKGKQVLDPEDVIKIPGIMARSIMEKGKAELGDKTILDALIPMSEAVTEEFKKGTDLRLCFHRGAAAAIKGAESTAGMIPKAGRAQWIGERVSKYQDGGAALCALIADLFIVKDTRR